MPGGTLRKEETMTLEDLLYRHVRENNYGRAHGYLQTIEALTRCEPIRRTSLDEPSTLTALQRLRLAVYRKDFETARDLLGTMRRAAPPAKSVEHIRYWQRQRDRLRVRRAMRLFRCAAGTERSVLPLTRLFIARVLLVPRDHTQANAFLAHQGGQWQLCVREDKASERLLVWGIAAALCKALGYEEDETLRAVERKVGKLVFS
jgi:hypothetical protein